MLPFWLSCPSSYPRFFLCVATLTAAALLGHFILTVTSPAQEMRTGSRQLLDLSAESSFANGYRDTDTFRLCLKENENAVSGSSLTADLCSSGKRVHIAIGIDNTGLEPIPTLLNSVDANHRNTPLAGCLDVHLVTMDVSSTHPIFVALREEALAARRWPALRLHLLNFTYLQVANDVAKMPAIRPYRIGAALHRNVNGGGAPITRAASLRIWLPHLLPKSVGRVLYLDYDVIVDASLEGIFELPMRQDEGIAARSFPAEKGGGRAVVRGWLENAGVGDKFVYTGADRAFNSGVLLMNLVVLRCMNFSSTLGRWNELWGINDQTALNLFFNGSYHELDRRYNTFIDSEDTEHVSPSFEPAIIHYKGAIKPWSRPDSWEAFITSHTRRHSYASLWPPCLFTSYGARRRRDTHRSQRCG
ncbi:unnamed protein product [Vitrella brassicaformis CCMP3155]|uniref:Hexosyltransferase n=1 Tax=Vitrella brassicaformis (strain CCMP3155) TaxID=1169540 RepID=A0A0G4EBM1_VITBC|nr:unnamed protein product [Vitrella brassicaformis CCMP3155]|eukprot:CEL93034.1 unnamed protein product [Vitrella brassicaformis CCMP3155]